MGGATTSFVLRSVGLSALAGARSMSPPALLGLYLGRRRVPPGHPLAARLQGRAARATLLALALGELVGDKLPQTPDRTALPPLLGRAATGGGVGALLWSLRGLPAWAGGGVGALSAVAGTFATYQVRAALGRALPVPHASAWAGLVEDGLVWGLGWWLLTVRGTRQR